MGLKNNLNTVSHRDYPLPGSVLVRQYPLRLQITTRAGTKHRQKGNRVERQIVHLLRSPNLFLPRCSPSQSL